jgi:hypothetical protein
MKRLEATEAQLVNMEACLEAILTAVQEGKGKGKGKGKAQEMSTELYAEEEPAPRRSSRRKKVSSRYQ